MKSRLFLPLLLACFSASAVAEDKSLPDEAVDKELFQDHLRTPAFPQAALKPMTRLPHLLQVQGLEFTVSYPEGWGVQQLGGNMVSLYGPRDSALARVHAFFLSSGYGGEEDSLSSIIEALRDELRGLHSDARLETKEEFSLGELTGKRIRAEFQDADEPTCQWLALVSDENGAFFFLFLQGPKEAVERNHELLEKVFLSLRPVAR